MRDQAETRPVAEVAIRVGELRMVKYVENVQAKLRAHTFVNGRILLHRKISVVQARPTANRTWRVLLRSSSLRGELGIRISQRAKIVAAILAGIQPLELPD